MSPKHTSGFQRNRLDTQPIPQVNTPISTRFGRSHVKILLLHGLPARESMKNQYQSAPTSSTVNTIRTVFPCFRCGFRVQTSIPRSIPPRYSPILAGGKMYCQ